MVRGLRDKALPALADHRVVEELREMLFLAPGREDILQEQVLDRGLWTRGGGSGMIVNFLA